MTIAMAMVMTSCIFDHQPDWVNPTYDGSTIKAELAINVPVGNSSQPLSRMSAETVQDQSILAENRFRGLQDIVLIPYKATRNLGGDNLVVINAKNQVNGSSEMAAAPMSLSAFSSSNIDNWYIDNGGSQLLGSSQVYSDVTIPIDTKHFLLYGRAMVSAAGDERDFINGVLQAGDGSNTFQNYLLSQTTDMSSARFSLKQVKAHDMSTQIADAQAYLLKILNNLLEVNVPAHVATAESAMGWEATAWKNLTTAVVRDDHGVVISDVNQANVAALYLSLIADGKSELQAATAGSANSIRLRLDALYRSALSYTRHLENDGTYTVYKRTDAGAGDLAPILSSTMAYAIMDAITAMVTPDAKAGKQLFQFSTDGLTETFGWAPMVVGDTWLTNFPSYFHLPDGTYQLAYDAGHTDQFSYVNFQIGSTTPGSAQMLVDPSQVCYPAELIYLGNSGLRQRQGVNDTWRWPTTLEAWNDADGVLVDGIQKEYWPTSAGWYETAVNTQTTAIALKDQVQYAVASLKTRVKCAAQSLTDNRSVYDNVAGDQQVPVPNTGLRITGLLIGNQPDEVDWNLMPTKKTNGSTYVDGDFSRIIYDRDVPVNFYAPYTTSIETCVPNFTLLLDNYNESNAVLANAVKVNVALELENNTGVGFYGVHGGFIPVGGKFYIIGKMDINGITDANRHGTDHVFQKDYMTEANFTITALKYAYNVIPDLRSAKLEFGLSVDIDWKSGAVFDINVGETLP